MQAMAFNSSLACVRDSLGVLAALLGWAWYAVWVWVLTCRFCDWRLICLIVPLKPPAGRLTGGGRRLWPAFGLALGCAVVSDCGRFTSHDSASGLRVTRVEHRLMPSPNEAAR